MELADDMSKVGPRECVSLVCGSQICIEGMSMDIYTGQFVHLQFLACSGSTLS